LIYKIQTITDRLRVAKDSTGAAAFRNQDSIKPYQKRQKSIKIEDRELPINSRPQNKFVRVPISLRILDNVGVDLQGNRGNDAYKTIAEPSVGYFEGSNSGESQRSGTINRAPPPMMNAPSFINNPPPLSAPAFAPPSFNNAMPPPPPISSLPLPPPMMNNMPPPPDFGLPPPPPSSYDFDLPPPPPPL